MRRLPLRERPNLAARCTELGFAFHTIDGEKYWDESACYAFTLEQIERDLEAPTGELAALCLELVDRVAGSEEALERLAIPRIGWDLIAESWKGQDPSLYGRFDLSYDGKGPAKLLEYNADTPTSLFEAAVFQWVWLEDALAQGFVPEGADQFNSLHEKLIARLGEILEGYPIHLAGFLDDAEDGGCLAYLADCARQAKSKATLLKIEDLGLSNEGWFLDMQSQTISTLFKLYPWEWIWGDAYASSRAMRQTRFLEPAWKAVLSNKGMLPLLWDLAPGHPNLLPAYFEDDPRKGELGSRFARKPLYSREGANVLIVDGDAVLGRAEGPYGGEGYIRQALALLPDFSGNRPVIGSWLVGDEPCGMGIRESREAITGNLSRFLPHIIAD